MTIEYPDDDITGPIEPPKPKPIAPAPVAPAPVASAPVASPVVAPATNHEMLKFAAILFVCMVCSLSSGLMFAWLLSGRPDGPTPTVNAVELGRRFAPILAGTLADGFDEGRPLLKVGEGLSPADTALKAAFDRARKAAFDKHASDAIHSIVADGAKIETPAQLQQIQDLFDGFSKGLRQAK